MPTAVSIFVIGTRAQLIKVAPVLAAFDVLQLPYIIWFTGQHQESMDDLIDDFGVVGRKVYPKDAKERSSVGSLFRWLPSVVHSGYAFIRHIRVESGAKPNVIVHGDTLSTLLGAVAARFGGGTVVHIESGLTSHKLWSPFPEELIRRLVFRLADIAFCPNAAATVVMEKYGKCRVYNTVNNTILDSVRSVLAKVDQLPHSDEAQLVVSIHRFQNIYDKARLIAIVRKIQSLAQKFPITFVLHPATRNRLIRANLLTELENNAAIHLSPRLPYSAFLRLAAGAYAVITDGGSNQEELAYLGVPTVLLRDRSERPDGLGENAILEADLPCELTAYVINGAVESLRRPPMLAVNSYPSRYIAEKIACLSGIADKNPNSKK